MSVAYFEVSRQVELRRRLFLNTGAVHTNMSSVWALPAAILLPRALAVCLVAIVFVHLWFRVTSHGDAVKLHRFVFSAATIAISCAAASVVVGGAGLRGTLGSDPAVASLVMLAVVALFWSVNTVLVAAAIVLSTGSRQASALLGSWSENALEFATLGLGGVTAALVVRAPWFAAIVLPAVFLLQHRALLKQLVEAATIDTKTELLNASAWRQLADRELLRAERDQTSLAVMVIDMDRFKNLNDTYGHLAGDTALKAVAEALADELRGYDAVGRFGGEEFVALLPGVDRATGARVGERVRRRIESLSVHVERRTGGSAVVTVTASIGVAAMTAAAGVELDDLLRAADAALYTAKGDGRNLVRIAPLMVAAAS